MIKVSVSIRQATNRWSQVEREVRSRVEDLVVEYADLIVQMARRLAPVKTGYLHDHILVQHVRGQLRALAVADTSYSGFVEFGTRLMAARPYLTPAFEHYKPQFLRRLKEVLGARVIYHRRVAELGVGG